MGGINHQPCGRYLQNSTLMSRCLSKARIAFETSNIALEDAILADLMERPVHGEPLQASLRNAVGSLDDMSASVARLRAQMDAEQYEDLPPVKSGAIAGHGLSLAKEAAVSQVSWDIVWSLYRTKGFYSVLDHLSARITNLKGLTIVLQSKVDVLVETDGTMSPAKILEENRVGNFRLEYAKLYTAWSVFQQEFLASALISTETWYQHIRAGSLLRPEQSTMAA